MKYQTKFPKNHPLQIVFYLTLILGGLQLMTAQTPGGVSSDLSIWLKADSDVFSDTGSTNAINNGTIQQWNDQSSGTSDFGIISGIIGPSYFNGISNTLNFNPQVSFNGSQALESSVLMSYPSGNSARLMRVVATPTATFSGDDIVFGHGSPSNTQAHLLAGRQSSNTMVYGSWGATNDKLKTNFWELDTPVIAGGRYNGSTTFIDKNGVEQTGVTGNPTWNTVNNIARIGTDVASSPSFFWTGNIAEVIVYDANISAADQQKIDSYLALKYGIEMEQDYLASDGTTNMWADDNDGYDSDIFGIGRDDNSGLNQRVSKSVNANSILSIALDADFTTANTDASRSTTHTNDRQFLTLANNGSTISTQSTEIDGTTYNVRIAREWKVDKTTNFNQSINMKFEGFDETWTLIKDSDGDFTSGFTSVGNLNTNGEITGASLSDGEYLTLAKLIAVGPGGVASGLEFWVKADSGVFEDADVNGGSTDMAEDGDVVEAWHDASGLGNHLDEPNGGNPTYVINGINYNPAIDFDGDDWLQWDENDAPWFEGDQDITLYSVVQADVATGFRGWLDTDANNEGASELYIRFTDGQTGIALNATGNTESRYFDNDGNPGNTIEFRTTKPLVVGFSFDGTGSVSGSSGSVNSIYDGFYYGREYPVADPDGISPSNRIGTEVDQFRLGNGEAANSPRDWDGKIAEVFTYDRILTDNERQRIESYFSIKYGTTFDPDFDGDGVAGETGAINEGDYLASNSSVIYDYSANSGYTTDVFGVGRDDVSGLDQRVSQSVNTANGPILSTAAVLVTSNQDPALTSLGNGNFMMMAHNNGIDNSFTSSFDSGTNNRSDRVWKIEETGTVGNVYIAIPKSGYSFPAGIPALVLSDDTLFDSTDTIINLTDGGTVYAASIDPADGQFLAFVTTTPDFSVSETTLTIDENTATNTFTVVLDTEPTSDVVFDVSSDDTGEATVDVAQVTFTTSNWDTPQTITVTGVDDDIDRDDSATITVSVNAVGSEDAFDSLADQTVAITLTDDDTVGFTQSETALTIAEDGGTNTFTVVLDSEPTSDVVFDVSSDDINEATVSSAQLTFTAANWDTPQTITVTGVDDAVDRDDSATITVTVNDTDSEDTFDALADQTVAITLTDDDAVGFTQNETALTIAEDGGTDTFTIVLDSEPTSDIIFDVSSNDTDEATVSAAQLTFTAANWDTPQTITVTGVEDDIDRDDSATITVAINDAGSEDTFDALANQTVAITLTDDDTLGFIQSETALTIAEDGGTNTFTVVLGSEPESDVVFDVSSNDTNETTVSTAQLTFTSANWDTAQTITITGVDDDNDRDDSATITVAINDAGSDNAFDALADQTVAITLTDDDTAGFTQNETALTIAEDGGTDTFTIVLDSEPTSDVVFDVSSNDTDEATVSAAQLTFTAVNWDTPQTITVTGVEDNIDRDDSATITVTVNDAGSDDTFDALANQTVAITLTNDDIVGFIQSETALTIAEDGGTNTFTVVLGSEPESDVVFDVSSNDTNETTVSTAQLTFTSANWDTAQTITITGVDDDIDRDDSATITVAINDAGSDDAFDALANQTVAITLTDDDAVGFTQSEITLTIAEDGGTDTFTIILDSEPTSDVVFDISSDDTNEATVNATQLTFTAANWDTPQTATVTGVDDDIDRDDSATITVTVNDAGSDDAFDSSADQSVTIIITDDDLDTDGDGILDGTDNCPAIANNSQLDTDSDGDGDVCDSDDDGDGTPDVDDDFPLDENETTDTDGDGTGDNSDTDDDGDVTPDVDDAFPLDENEDTDTDGDGTGNNADTDDDGDGTPDADDDFPLDENETTDTDGDGTGDNSDTDDDGDGTPDADDDFPLDENEDTDTDGDGTGNNADTDDDGDGTPDVDDAFPLDENEDTDTDGDGTGNNADTDDDGDGTPDVDDAFPLDENEDTDTDGDGIGDNADTDDDGDGIPDEDDDFPLGGDEIADNDGDGIPDDEDTDDDNDGTPDLDDDFPLDENEDTDTDGDGTGDNSDTDDDGDGIPDNEDADVDGDGILDNGQDTDGDGINDENDETDDRLDTDGDGVPDEVDAFPNDPDESIDVDGDGIGSNADSDDSDPNVGLEQSITAAEAFTPNGDNINDTWIVQGIENHPNAVVTVYNRYGHEVFKTIGYQNDWNGKSSSRSENLPSGSYYYVIELQNGSAPVNGWIFINY
ncbi:gliding motility-associated C-terminal domain-containing protein [Maribacter sp. ACAM166]|uniref:gliding motility-associated C-terminal domain-containing protein n=1 Tax=Maribacter sp. ACAM166 TaxID=2508996 RepID=UPI0010FEB890|nr:gliding motility-associated C-terminal domain-containing protein [Maribacter sp. ACAM166]TLP75640.1 gliding motility-associated C-terminal domain-containing protein [Maribacter sp. ACAM166]